MRTTTAAVLAWGLVGLVPGPWSGYPYYAPLGAVIATSVSVRGSTRRTWQAVLAIAIGAVVARLTDALPLPSPAGLATVVLVGMLISGWRALGEMGSWVPTSALFVLVIGDSDPVGYVSAYIGLTLVGALVGVGVNVVLPQLPLTPADRALSRVREGTVEHFTALAAALRDRATDVPADEPLRTARSLAAAAVSDAQEAALANWSARRYQTWRRQQDGYAHALDTAADVALEADRVVAALRDLDPDVDGACGTPGALAGADALDAAAAMARDVRDDGTADEAADRLRAALDAVQEAVAQDRAEAGGTTRPVDGLVVTLTRLLGGPGALDHGKGTGPS